MALVFERFGAGYVQKFSAKMPQAHRDAMNAILDCRTPAMGAHLVKCNDCHVAEFVYHSCRHRACPKCSASNDQKWLEARREEILPVPYFHVVFTVPQALRSIIRKEQRALYPAFMAAVGQTLLEVGRDPRNLGGTIGAMTVLHTWTRALEYHPHVHCLLPAGFIDPDGEWREVTRPWLAPQEVLAKVFRAKLAKAFRAAVPGLRLPGSIFHKKWVVHVDKPKHGTDIVLKYLARYVHRVAISERRILDVSDTHVTFRYRNSDRTSWLVMSLPGHEFIRRFLQHVLPKRFHKIRYVGFWSCGKRPALRALRETLLAKQPPAPAPTTPSPELEPANDNDVPVWLRCPHCELGQRVIIRRFDRHQMQALTQEQAADMLARYSRPPPRAASC